ncbi:hypothetical protein BaRGS_00022402 [Batillaria attramentaria]|uniref:Arylsulfatase n=1 Tax=Batillaria attramentaria TaxID=370345 RepID=A0ABD0KGU8_9CAEN
MIDGVSQWRSIKYDTLSPRTGFVYNIDSLSNHGAIRDGDWKLIKGSPGNWNDWYPVPGVDDQEYQSGSDADDLGPNDYQLFNIKDDPTERNDVKEKYPDVLAKMKARLEELWKGEIPANFPKGDPASNPKNFNGAWSPGWC